MIRMIEKIAGSDQVVLITGETGTGKELVARAIHAESDRVSQPFIAKNCAAIPEGLIESELFGHKKGAFTGAGREEVGAFVSAGNGVIFLDEIGDMSEIAQAKILRVLEDKAIQRVGSADFIRAPARVIAATRQNLKEMVSQGRFREDLYYRLNILQIHVPALRERKDDIPRLFHHFIDIFFPEAGRNAPAVEDQIYAALIEYAWPGNIRELKNLVYQLAILHEDGPIGIDDVRLHIPDIQPNTQSTLDLRHARESAEKERIEEVMAQCGGSVKTAAAVLDESIWNLYKKLTKYNIKITKTSDARS
jgi:transcriptional regulator with PAS, ATPase and Fis domain